MLDEARRLALIWGNGVERNVETWLNDSLSLLALNLSRASDQSYPSYYYEMR